MRARLIMKNKTNREETSSKGIIGSERHERYNVQHDSESDSNMTTPVARPLPDSPISDVNSPESRYQNLDERLERLPQLPPSLLASHSTAAAASRALRETSASTQSRRLSPSSTSDSESSPFKSKHRRAESSQSLRSLQNLSPSTGRPPAPSQALLSSPLALRPTLRAPPSQRQEDRRAALRDYQKQARPLLTFDEPPSSPTPSGGISSQSFGDITSQASSDQQLFPMFSTSDSSHDSPADGGSLRFRPLPDRDAEKNATGSAAGYAGQATFGAQQIDASGRREATSHQRGVRSDLGTDAEMDERRRIAENIRAKRARESYEITEVFGVDSASDGFRFGMDGIAVGRDEARTKIVMERRPGMTGLKMVTPGTLKDKRAMPQEVRSLPRLTNHSSLTKKLLLLEELSRSHANTMSTPLFEKKHQSL